MIETYQDAVGGWRFRIKGRNGEVIASSESYTREADARRGVASLLRILVEDDKAETGPVWECKIGGRQVTDLPRGADSPMRVAVANEYRRVTGRDPEFIFSGWGGALTEGELAVVEDRDPSLPGLKDDGPTAA